MELVLLRDKGVNILSQFFLALYFIISFAFSFTSRINAVETVLTCYFPEIPKLRGTSRMLHHVRPVSSSLEHRFVPEEVFRSLNCASTSLYRPENLRSLQTTKTPTGFRVSVLATPAFFCPELSVRSLGKRKACRPCKIKLSYIASLF